MAPIRQLDRLSEEQLPMLRESRSEPSTTRLSRRFAFTLVELLIVVIILAVLGAIVVPQFLASSADAKLAALDANLRNLRSAVALYHHEHGDYPADRPSGLPSGGANTEIGFIGQLTQYTDDVGKVSASADATHIYGPYLTRPSLPEDPFLGNRSIVVGNAGSLPLQADSDPGPGGWKFDTRTGVLIVNLRAHQGR